jgi:hypothetical protein
MRGFKRIEKVICPIKLPKVDRDKSKIKLVEDRLSFQKVMEVCFYAYLKNDPKIMELVTPYAGKTKRGRELTELEAIEILKMLEAENPMKGLAEEDK